MVRVKYRVEGVERSHNSSSGGRSERWTARLTKTPAIEDFVEGHPGPRVYGTIYVEGVHAIHRDDFELGRNFYVDFTPAEGS